jgi:hypothetical protein
MREPIKQHYVSRRYLRRFAVDGRLWVFDKPTLKSFPQSVENVAYEKHFYDLPPDAVEQMRASTGDADAGVQIRASVIETALVEVDGRLSAVTEETLRVVRQQGRINSDLRHELAIHTALQDLRTPTARQSGLEAVQKGVQSLIDRTDALKGLVAKTDPSRASLFHVQSILTAGAVDAIASALDEHVLIVSFNRGRRHLYTCDHPVARHAGVRDPVRSHTGFASRGIRVFFPISSRCVVQFFERGLHRRLAHLDGHVVPLDDEQVTYLNTLQSHASSRQIYCESDDFELARTVCAQRPDLRDPDRPRVWVG